MNNGAPDHIDSGVDLVIGQLEGKTKHPKIGITYHLGLLLVSLGMIILPLVYVALILAIGQLTYLHITHGQVIFEHSRGWLSLLIYLGPIVIGLILIVFMVKPLFAKPAKKSDLTTVDREDQPLLFAYLDALCTNLGSPIPKKVVIDSQVNASAGFTKGYQGWLTNNLTLTIGTPLISGLTLEQLTGVLAHEFGHFSQSGGMRLSYIIRSINNWFLRVVYERDEMDEWLERTQGNIDGRIGIILMLASVFIWISRRILWGLMRAGDLISCYLMRQMEFDADLNEILIVGSRTFEKSSLRFIELSIGESEAQAALNAGFQEGRMSSDYAGMVANYADTLKPTVMKKVKGDLAQEKTEVLATHPCTRERIERAESVAAQGIVHSTVSSTELFRKQASLTEEVSLNLYNLVYGEAMKQIEICPNDTLIQQREAETADYAGLETFFKDQISFLRPIQLPEEIPQTASSESLSLQHEEWQASLDDYKRSMERYNNVVEKTQELERISALSRCNLVWKEKTMGFPMFEPFELENRKDHALEERVELNDTLTTWEIKAGERLATALASTANRSDTEITKQYNLLVELAKMIPEFHEMHHHVIQLETIFQAANAELSSPQMGHQAQQVAELLSTDLKEIQAELAKQLYPFDHAQGAVSLAKIYLPSIPSSDIGELYNTALSVYQGIAQLYYRLAGRLGRVAEATLTENETAISS